MFRTAASHTVLCPPDELDAASAPQFARVARDAITHCSDRVLIIDLQNCVFIDAIAIDLLIELRSLARQRGIDLQFGHTPAAVRRVAALLGLGDAFGLPASDGPAQRAELRARAARARAAQREQTAELDARVAATADTVAQLACELAQAAAKIENLELALRTSRRIGQAIGIVMARLKISEDAAFEILCNESRDKRRKLRDIADDIVRTGDVPAAEATARA